MAGVHVSGFILKTLDEILTELASQERQAFGDDLNTSTESLFGQINGIVGDAIAQLWESQQGVYSASNILDARGNSLDRKVASSPIQRAAASPSTVIATINLDDGVTVPALSQAHVDGYPDRLFETTEAVTNSSGVTANFTVLMQSTDTGPIRANAGTLGTIATPVAGWNSVTNVEDASLGADQESDASLLARYLRTAAGRGLSTLGALSQSVSAVEHVSAVLIAENDEDFVDPGTGITPHSIEVVIRDGGLALSDEVAQAIWDKKAGGIKTYGALSGTATDALGDSQAVNFSRVSELSIYLDLDLTVSSAFSAADLAALKTAVAEWGDANIGIGDDVILSQLCQPVFAFGGVVDIVEARIGIAPSPSQTTNYSVQPREVADLDTGRITVNFV